MQGMEACLLDLCEQLKCQLDSLAMVAIISTVCLNYLGERHPLTELLSQFDEPKKSPIKSIAQKTSVSERRLQEIHKAHFGFTAKEMQRYQRFKNTTKFVNLHHEKIDWSEVVFQFGYFDQSQLIKDFQYYLGTTPTAYCHSRANLCGLE